ncbi:hypothetical protein [Piscirickettsia salmonis]|nr:hypothetical protein [Piscirickettsia salmonis]
MDLENYGTRFSPYLLDVPMSILNQVEEIHPVLVKAIIQIVNNYLLDDDLQEILKLDDRKLSLIKLASEAPYQLFSIRPDFLISENNEVKLCEINARFTINGFMGSYYTHLQTKEDYSENQGIEDKIARLIDNYTSRFDLSKPLFLMRQNETGYDLNLLKIFLIDRGVDIIDIEPQDLSLANKKLVAKGVECKQLIMELHQNELENISDDILEHIILNVNYVNDIRTIFITHDKRLFSILSNSKIMNRYLSNEEVGILSKHIIETYLLSKAKDEVINNKNNWVLKKCLSGKGEGMYIGAEASLPEITNVIDNQAAQYIAQPFLAQKKIEIFIDGEYRTCNAVGMILSLNGAYQGTGIFRVSPNSIIAVSRGGCIVVPSFS